MLIVKKIFTNAYIIKNKFQKDDRGSFIKFKQEIKIKNKKIKYKLKLYKYNLFHKKYNHQFYHYKNKTKLNLLGTVEIKISFCCQNFCKKFLFLINRILLIG